MDTSPVTQSPACTRSTLEDGTYVFTFTESTRRAVDEWFDHISLIYANIQPDTRVQMIMDVRRSGLMPLRYGFTRLRQWMPTVPHHPPVRLAIVHSGDVIMTLFDAFISAARIGHLTSHGFRSLDEALVWVRRWV